jgi:16S rRNA (cytidine1402-2'-O)-methyltransferase
MVAVADNSAGPWSGDPADRDRTGRLVLLGAPLGNAADASARLRDLLGAADVVAAEDTRRLARLARDLAVNVTGRVVSYFEGNEERRTADLVDAVRGGALVAVITDGGMPSVSDPGFRLVRAVLDAGLPVTAAPGPSAVTTAVALSGLPSDRFCFEGFLPRRPAERRARLRALAAEPRTLVLFEAPHRLAAALTDLTAAFGQQRPAAVCRELTKTYEEVRRAPLGELAGWAAERPPRGEITLVVGGAPERTADEVDDAELRAAIVRHEAAGRSRRDAVAEVAREYGVPRRRVYALAIG